MRDLLINALRMRPDRIVLGETHGEEALDLLQAINTGHDGSMTTVHANSPRDALTRLEIMATSSDFALPLSTVRQMMASAVDIVVQVTRMQDGSRKVVNITEVQGMEGETIVMQDIFALDQAGHHVATGVIPKCYNRLRDAGADLPVAMFTPRRRATEVRERRQVVTTLVGDLRGFTKYSERHAPEHVAEMLNAYLEWVGGFIGQQEDVLHKYLSDMFWAFFCTTPTSTSGDAWRAVSTAWRIRQGIHAFHRTLSPEDQFSFALGIHTGEATLVRMEQGRAVYVGDAVNLAVYVDDQAGGGQVVISEITYQLVRDRVEAQKLRKMSVKGHRKRVQLYEVIGLRE
jgi:class 3 adenylate cyclase